MPKHLPNILLIIALLGVGAWHYRSQQSAASFNTPTEPMMQSGDLQPLPTFSERTQWVDEQHWLVDHIVRDIAEMLAFASGGESVDLTQLRCDTKPTDRTSAKFNLQLSLSGRDSTQDLGTRT